MVSLLSLYNKQFCAKGKKFVASNKTQLKSDNFSTFLYCFSPTEDSHTLKYNSLMFPLKNDRTIFVTFSTAQGVTALFRADIESFVITLLSCTYACD